MAGRNRAFSEEKVLECAAELFMVKGFASTSTEDLLAVMNINKGSLYNSFGSKRALFIKVLQYYADRYVGEFKKRLEASEEPVAVIKKTFLDVVLKGTRDSYKRGCFLGNTILEQASLDEELKIIASGMLKELEDVYYRHIKLAQKNKQLQTTAEPRILARHLTNLWNGINLTARIYSSSRELLPVLKFNLDVLS